MASTSEKLELKIVGTRPIRPDGVDKVTGRANFGADMKMAGMLHGRIKRSPHPHARVLRIDTVKALALPVLRHRLLLRPEAELEGITPDRVVENLLATTPVPR